MAASKWYSAICAILMMATGGYAQNSVCLGQTEYGCEIMLSKMDYLEYKLLEMELQLREEMQTMIMNQETLTTQLEHVSWSQERMEQSIERHMQTITTHNTNVLKLLKVSSNYESLKNSIFQLKPIKAPSDNSRFMCGIESIVKTKVYESCAMVPATTSGIYRISLDTELDAFEVYCEQEQYGGGWIVIQRRIDGSVNFYRNFSQYEEGFGDLAGEYWMGLRRIHEITNSANYELMVMLTDYSDTFKYARYVDFAIGNSSTNYDLKTVTWFSGAAGDSLAYSRGQKFSAYDKDNDASSKNCAQTTFGAWWYKDCTYSNLNGKYINAVDDQSSYWQHFSNNHQGLKSIVMMIRELK